MICEVPESISRFVILDVTGVYARVYDEFYVPTKDKARVYLHYRNLKHWRVVEI